MMPRFHLDLGMHLEGCGVSRLRYYYTSYITCITCYSENIEINTTAEANDHGKVICTLSPELT